MAIRGEIILCILPSTGVFTFNHAVHTADRAKGFVFMEAAQIDGNFNTIYSLGYADGDLHNIGNACGQGEQFGVCLSSRGYTTSYSIIAESTSAFFGGAVNRMRAYVSAVNIGSFQITVDWNQIPGAGFYAVMLTGDSDVSIKVGVAHLPPGVGVTLDVNLGYPAVALLTLGTPEQGFNGEVAGIDHSNGFATLCGTLQVGMNSRTHAINSNAASYCSDSFIERDTDIVNKVYGTNGTSAIFSYSVNGFTVKRIAGNTSFGMWDIGYMAIGGAGVSANLIRITQPSVTGVQNNPTLVPEPIIAFFSSRCKPASSAVLADARMTFGACVGTQNRVQTFTFTDGVSFPYSRHAYMMDTKCISMATATGVGSSTKNAEASCSFSPNNLALNWTTVDAIARDVWALVLSPNDSGIVNACGQGVEPVCVPREGDFPLFAVCVDTPLGQIGVPYSDAIQGLNGFGSYNYSLLSGTLPAGLSLNPGTGAITGTPTTAQTSSFTVRVTDNAAASYDVTCAITITP